MTLSAGLRLMKVDHWGQAIASTASSTVNRDYAKGPPRLTARHCGLRGSGISQSDILAINQTDLAPHVHASRDVMEADPSATRSRLFVFTVPERVSSLRGP